MKLREAFRWPARPRALLSWWNNDFDSARWQRIAVRIVAWLCIPVFALTGWEIGQSYLRTRDITYVVDTKILVTNPRIEDPDEHQRLIALGKTRDDTVFLGGAVESPDFQRLLVANSGVAEDSFVVTSTATRAARTITLRVTSKDPRISSVVAVRVFVTMQQYLDQHRGSVYLDTGIAPTEPAGITAYYAGVGADWPVSGTVLGMITGFTVVVVSARLPQLRRGSEHA